MSHRVWKMLAKAILALFLLVHLISGENIFFTKLNRLLDFCEKHEGQVDDGTLLGISFAKGILSSVESNLEVKKLLRRCEQLERTSTSASNEIGE